MKTKIFIDFDNTIFDTEKFRQKIFKVFDEVGCSLSTVDEEYKIAYSDYHYSPYKHMNLLAERTNFDTTETKYLLDQIFREVSDCIFPDAVDFLRSIDHQTFEFNLLSMGDTEFQSLKINNSDVQKHFSHIYITDKQKWDYLSNLISHREPFIFIDDRADTVNHVGEHFPRSLAIEINRINIPSDPLEPKVQYGNIIISNFDQLLEIIHHFEVHKSPLVSL